MPAVCIFQNAAGHIPENTRCGFQFAESPALHNAALVHHKDFIAVLQSGQPVGNGNHGGTTFVFHVFNFPLNQLL